MKKHSKREKENRSNEWEERRREVIGLGEKSFGKTYFPELKARIRDLERYQTIFDHLHECLFVLDKELIVQEVNEAALHLLEREEDAVQGRPVSELFSEEDFEAIGLASSQPFSCFNASLSRGEEQIPVELRLHNLMHEGEQDVIVMIAIDARPAIQAQEERESFLAKLETAKHLRGIGALTAGIAHDFNNLITVGKVYTSLMKEDLHELGLELELVDDLLSLLESAKETIAGLLDYAKGVNEGDADFDLHGCVEKNASRFKVSHPEIRLGLLLDAPDAGIRGDEAEIARIIINLLMNAAQALEGKGRIEVHTFNRWIGRGSAASLRVEEGAYLCLQVKDNGPGIPPELVEKVFTPFFSTKGEGTGLGLANSIKIARSHGGWLTVQSDPNALTTFTLGLPVASSLGSKVTHHFDRASHLS